MSKPGSVLGTEPAARITFVALGDDTGVVAVDDTDGTVGVESSRAGEDGDLSSLQETRETLEEAVDDLVLAVLAGGEVDLAFGDVDAELAGVFDGTPHVGGLEELLGREHNRGAGRCHRPCRARQWRC